MTDLACVGEIMLDVRVAAPLAAPGRPAHGTIRVDPGGSPVTAARWAAAGSATAIVLGRAGDDAAAGVVEETLRAEGVEARLLRTPAAATGTCIYHGAGVVADRGANAALGERDIPPALSAEAVLVSGYLLHEDTRAAAEAALRAAQARWVALDVGSPAMVALTGAERLLRLAEHANVLLVNEREAHALTGRDARSAAAELGTRFEVVFVKLGSRGALAYCEGRLIAREEPSELPSAPGAGDAFAAGALIALVRGAAVETALAAGCRHGAALARSGPDPAAAAIERG